MMTRPRRLAAAVSLALFVGCAAEQPEGAPVDDAAALRAIQEASDAFEAAYLRGDADAIAGGVTTDAVISPIGFVDLEGRDAVRSALGGALQAMTVTAYSFTVREVEVYGDTAYDRGTFLWESSVEGQPSTRTDGRYHAMRVRGTDGVWRIHRLIENELPGSS